MQMQRWMSLDATFGARFGHSRAGGVMANPVVSETFQKIIMEANFQILFWGPTKSQLVLGLVLARQAEMAIARHLKMRCRMRMGLVQSPTGHQPGRRSK